ncbi:MAG: hypothetical protein A3H57_02730 [Candidatus Taylorbacteria bacterium RIFCSPLOWO2_02_FULL_43_11]|uniref:Uncharacterized protein n=1 Tax=Candidatus Taylorbacteria bacterium RIFCSPHIGHO2_02_FULL_43_32b TaxID=1802306 RepID=A0A1G2MEK3_9BACT|nr:MAG: hypothetical protein A2743_01115 [Candidatus Taylorbacteria bacterium RIFCSPHIGHO2_01_FULL_43_47]OHA22340.1 MAG: hypothetical protein A3C72_04650 [Candidatus Taylorbacteria bacterium RIFCSPHIGHO2_02_FULL_43_32b]OHA29074.1 MAG: hypothetical protein A3B08_02885 [Candidatus Taylorbacteria bacterium RIFCSPLOWO2_01_FULL_43_44]OHA36347.1 MAG: hypothetical protein A3H57_02730 [Candidatus Taylorbacteria bacterium RIFCSPLOWO2_02_FULL_43_11]
MAVAVKMIPEPGISDGTYKCTDTLGRMEKIKLSSRGYAFDINTSDNRFTCRVENPRLIWQTPQ